MSRANSNPKSANAAIALCNPRRPSRLVARMLISLTLALLSRGVASAGDAYLVKDINKQPGSSNPRKIVEVGGIGYFLADHSLMGTEIWRTDGTSDGTRVLKDLMPGRDGGYAAELVNMNGVLYFRGYVSETGRELWKSDGTAEGTVLVKDINPDYSWSNPEQLTVLDGILFFIAGDGEHGRELWRSDGTEDGTLLVKDINPGNADGVDRRTRFLVAAGDLFYFAADDGEHGFELWKSDGTERGTVLVRDINPGSGNAFRFRPGEPRIGIGIGDKFFFVANDGEHGDELWVSDGSEEGTALLKDIRAGSRDGIPLLSRIAADLNGILLFAADTQEQGTELWRTDGTSEGTRLVKDIAPGFSSARPRELTLFKEAIFFQVSDELWKSDGTEGGTVLVKDFRMGSGTFPRDFTVIGETMFLAAADASRGSELWRSDGTGAGTRLVRDIWPDSGHGNPDGLAEFDGRLLFAANDGEHGVELWLSDGSEQGTRLVHDVRADSADSTPSWMTSFGDIVLMSADNGLVGEELWKSDGTKEGTKLLKDLTPGKASSLLINFANIGESILFGTRWPSSLWRSDGTEQGTIEVVDGLSWRLIGRMPVVNGLYFFPHTDPGHGIELWKSDGTAEETGMVKDIWPGTSSAFPRSYVAGDRFCYFAADDGEVGRELWKSDGTEQGTVRVKDTWPGPDRGFPAHGVYAAGLLFFTANDGVHGRELWRSDGSEEGTYMVKDIDPDARDLFFPLAAVGSIVYFPRNEPQHGTELWRSDGTAEGTYIVKDITPGPDSTPLGDLVGVNDTLFFRVGSLDGPYVLWKSDGTEDGTVPIAPIPTKLSQLTNADGVLFFSGAAESGRRELWHSNGTPTGTFPIRGYETVVLGGHFAARDLAVAGNRLFFRAVGNNAGDELWAVDLPVLLPGDLNCDGSIDLPDVEPFITALLDPAEYENKYPDCDIRLADLNHDGSVDLTDAEPFIELLLGP